MFDALATSKAMAPIPDDSALGLIRLIMTGRQHYNMP